MIPPCLLVSPDSGGESVSSLPGVPKGRAALLSAGPRGPVGAARTSPPGPSSRPRRLGGGCLRTDPHPPPWLPGSGKREEVGKGDRGRTQATLRRKEKGRRGADEP